MITREDAKKLLPIIKAYSEGKEIQFLNYEEEWIDKEKLSFDAEPYRYRIKSEPKYRPFKNSQECWEEMQKHQPFGWIIDISDKDYYTLITFLSKSADFDYLFKNKTFIDGTPFGIKEEE